MELEERLIGTANGMGKCGCCTVAVQESGSWMERRHKGASTPAHPTTLQHFPTYLTSLR